MLDALKAYYEANGISALDFRCQHAYQCGADSPRFTAAKESYVGPEYEAGNGPRLLFLSLDSGSADVDPFARTLAAVRAQTLVRDVATLPKHKHWYLTHLMAWELLRSFHPHLTIALARRHFAHVNSAKCCQNNEGRSKASGVLFRNCRPFIPGELRVLRPDIIVTQGSEARDVIVKECGVDRHEKKEVEGAAYEAGLVRFGERQPLWLMTYHPNNYGKFWPQKKACWPLYVNAVRDFMASKVA